MSKKATKKEAKKVAEKVTSLFNLIQELTERDIEVLKETKKHIQAEMSQLQTVGGILVDLDKADVKQELGRQAMSRINGIISIWEAVEKTPGINMEYQRKKLQGQMIEGMFGL